VIGDQEYCFDEATRQILTLADRCHTGQAGLFLHAFDESRSVEWADPVTGLSPEVWSEGLGWYALILVECLALMPPAHHNRGAVMRILAELAEGLRQTQDARSGLWYQVVDQGERADNWHDTSGSAMFVYAIQRAVDLGYIERQRYEPVARRGYDGIRSKCVVRDDGLVDIYDACDGVCVQRSYADYINYPKSVNAKEAVGSVLWAATMIEKPAPSSAEDCALRTKGRSAL
jgi:rhamnogalacturonyl hydrolase YesR